MSSRPDINFGKTSLFRVVAAEANLPVPGLRMPNLQDSTSQVPGLQVPDVTMQESRVDGQPERKMGTEAVIQSPANERPAKDKDIILGGSDNRIQEDFHPAESEAPVARLSISPKPALELNNNNPSNIATNDGHQMRASPQLQTTHTLASIVAEEVEAVGVRSLGADVKPQLADPHSQPRITTTIVQQIAKQTVPSFTETKLQNSLPISPVTNAKMSSGKLADIDQFNAGDQTSTGEQTNAGSVERENNTKASRIPEAAPSQLDFATQSAAEAIIASMIDAGSQPGQSMPSNYENQQNSAKMPQFQPASAPKIHIGSLEIRVDPPNANRERKLIAPVSFSGSRITSRRYLRSW